MGIFGVEFVHLVGVFSRGNIHLAADNRLYPLGFTRFVKFDSAVHYAVVGDSKGGLTEFLCGMSKLTYTAGAVKQTVFGMNM